MTAEGAPSDRANCSMPYAHAAREMRSDPDDRCWVSSALVPGCRSQKLVLLGLEALGLQTLEPQTEVVALPVQNLDLTARPVEKDEQYRVEYFDLDDQLDQAIDGLRKSTGLG